MGFIRTKKIKGNKYAYIVENSWKNSKVKQKVKRYLGRVYEFKRKDSDFEKFIGRNVEEFIAMSSSEDIIIKLVEWELLNHCFELKEGLYVNGRCLVDLKKKKIRNLRGSKIALGFNEGFLDEYSLRKLIRKKHKGEEQGELGYTLAKMFVETGIKIPHEVFVGYFSKLYK